MGENQVPAARRRARRWSREPVHRHDLQPLFEHGDEGQEQPPVDAVVIEIGRRAVGGGDQRDAEGEQGFEQAPQDHRVGDVGDLQFVEAEQPRARAR